MLATDLSGGEVRILRARRAVATWTSRSTSTLKYPTLTVGYVNGLVLYENIHQQLQLKKKYVVLQ